MGICLSHVQTQRIVEKLSSGHDKLLKEWKANIEIQQARSIDSPSVARSTVPADLVVHGLNVDSPSSVMSVSSSGSQSNSTTNPSGM